MAQAPESIAAFWLLFRQHAADLAKAGAADDRVYDLLLEQLQKIDSGLYLEYCAAPGAYELIVTAEGERSLFPIAREIVAAAPVIDGWTIRALKPNLGMAKTVRWEDLKLQLDDIVFKPLQRGGSEGLGLLMLVPGISEEETEKAYNALLRALDHALGEEKFAEAVEYTEVRPLPADAEAKDFIPLEKLDAFIQWWESRRSEQ